MIKEKRMKYYGTSYFNALTHSGTKRDLNGTSVSDEKGTDNKANNTSAYNHDYYVKHKDKWLDNNADGESSGAAQSTDEDEFDIDAAARDVIRGNYGNGLERKQALGDDYEKVQRRVNEMLLGNSGDASETKEESKEESKENNTSSSSSKSSSNTWYTRHERKIEEKKEKTANK